MDDTELRNRFAEIIRQHRQLRDEVHQYRKGSKDRWDKFSAISTFLSGFLIAAVGIIATTLFNSHQAKQEKEFKAMQTKLSQADITSRFFPYLNDPHQRKGALLIIATINDCKFAYELAETLAGESSIEAITELRKPCQDNGQGGAENSIARIVRTGDPKDSKIATETLIQLSSGACDVTSNTEVELNIVPHDVVIPLLAASLDGRTLNPPFRFIARKTPNATGFLVLEYDFPPTAPASAFYQASVRNGDKQCKLDPVRKSDVVQTQIIFFHVQ